MGFGEGSTTLPAGNVVINDDLLPLTIFADFYTVDAEVVLAV